MSHRSRHRANTLRTTGLAALVSILCLAAAAPAPAQTFGGPTYSSPITLSADGRLLWVVNPGGDNVAVISTARNRVIRRINVGNEPESVAVDPANRYAYVANSADGTVTVIRIRNANPRRFRAGVDRRVGRRGTLVTGSEPWNIVASPNGQRIYVANSGQDTITVIDGTRRRVRRRIVGPRVLGHINLASSRCNEPNLARHFQPRGLAVTRNSRRLFVTSFLSFTAPGGRQASDTGKRGVVCRVNINTRSTRIRSNRVAQRISLAPRVTGFQVDSNGDTIPDDTSAFPNQMQSIVIRGGQAYLPNVAASPDGPLRFNTSTMAFVNVINGVNGGRQTDGSANRFLNLHLGARTPETGKKRLFFANVWAMAFTDQRGSGEGYVVSAGSDLLVKVNVSGGGALSFTGGPQTTRYVDLNDPDNPATSGANAGKQPQGIVINRTGSRAYVANFLSRNVSVVDLRSDEVIRTIRVAPLPRAGSQEEVVAVGAEMFFSSRGNFNTPPGATVQTSERLSSEGWQSCASCHFEGLTDGVIWEFGSGPRKSVPLNATFNPRNRNEQRALNYSAIFDEVEDFDLNVRNVSGPGPIPATELPNACNTASAAAPSPTRAFRATHGLIISDNGNINEAPCAIPSLIPIANANRQQVTVTLPGSTVAVPAATALREWVRFAVRTPDGPSTRRGVGNRLSARSVRQGRALFGSAGCANCHGTNLFTNSRRLPPPPPAGAVFTERTGVFAPANPVGVQFVGSLLSNIGSFNLGVPGGGNEIGSNVGGDEITNAAGTGNQDALGRDYNNDGQGNGYNIPSLLGIDNVQPYYHNGACETLACVVSDAKHRTANNTQPDRLTSARDRARLVAFLKSIN